VARIIDLVTPGLFRTLREKAALRLAAVPFSAAPISKDDSIVAAVGVLSVPPLRPALQSE